MGGPPIDVNGPLPLVLPLAKAAYVHVEVLAISTALH
jgi:hypothetical protein